MNDKFPMLVNFNIIILNYYIYLQLYYMINCILSLSLYSYHRFLRSSNPCTSLKMALAGRILGEYVFSVLHYILMVFCNNYRKFYMS
jgi:hypothetical protein